MAVLTRAALRGQGIAPFLGCSPRDGLRAWALAGLLVLARLSIAPPASAETGGKVTQEYDLKAAFLFNFAQFVDWPADAFPSPSTPITIGILGEDPFGRSLDEVVAQETAHGRALVVRRYPAADRIDACHILFIAASEAGRMESVLALLARRSILTVGETKEFTEHSGIITFGVKQHRLRLRINMAAARAARLTISSKLLRQSEIVGDKDDRP